MWIFLSCLLQCCFVPLVIGHGNMVLPYTWFDAGGHIGQFPGGQCWAGADLPGLEGKGAACLWYNNWTVIPGEATLDPQLRTYRDENNYFEKNPWRSPGSAPVFSPCGVGGGNPLGCPEGESYSPGQYCPGGGYAFGPNAQDYEFPDVMTTEWKLGSVVEAAWAIVANHGGGYSYRLCKIPEEGVSHITEECFKKTSLDFDGDFQWVQFGEDKNNRTQFNANRTREGTNPPGSQWTKNPIPACSGNSGDSHDLDGGFYDPNCPKGTQFPSPGDGLMGWGQSQDEEGHGDYPGQIVTFHWSIVDTLLVPSDLEPGEYVLSWRWDCEQSPQVWATCANVKIVL